MTHRIALITGASRGIGRAVALRCVPHFSHVYCVGRDRRALEEVAGQLGEAAVPCECDLRDAAAVAALVRGISERHGALDLLVNNAAVMIPGKIEDTAVDDFDALMSANLRAPFLLMRACVPLLRGRDRATIVNVASLAPTVANPTLGVYAASKAGLIALSDALREEVREDGVRVSVILPGSTATSLHPVSDVDDATWMLDPDDVAGTVLAVYLAEPRALLSRVELRPVRKRPRRHPERR